MEQEGRKEIDVGGIEIEEGGIVDEGWEWDEMGGPRVDNRGRELDGMGEEWRIWTTEKGWTGCKDKYGEER